MCLDFLVLQGGVGDRGQVEHRVGAPPAKLRLPIQPGDIAGHKVALVTLQVWKGTTPKIVDHRQGSPGKFLLKTQNQVGTNESGPSRYPDRLHLFKDI